LDLVGSRADRASPCRENATLTHEGDEERSIALFLENYFEQHGIGDTLAMLRNAETKPEDLRAVIDGYGGLYRHRQN